MFGNKNLPLLLVIVSAMIVSIESPGLLNQVEVNDWSLIYSWKAVGNKKSAVNLSSPPPEHKRADIWLARDALKKNNPDKALSLLLSSHDVNDPEALRLLGEAWYKTGNFDQAVNSWRDAGDIDSIIAAGKSAVVNGDLNSAALAYKVAFDASPESTTLDYAKFLWIQKQDKGSAANILESSLSKYPSSPYRFSWLRHLGDLMRSQKKWKEAIEIYQEIIQNDKKGNNISAAYIGLGWCFTDGYHNEEKALEEFQQAVALDNASSDPYLALGQFYSRKGEYLDAIKWLQFALKRNPDSDIAYYEIAWAYRMNDQKQEAKSAIAQAIELNGKASYYYSRAGQIYEWAGEPISALNSYRLALKINPTNSIAEDGIRRLNDH